MASTVSVPVEQYLRTSYRPDCDYVDGEVQQRNLGERWYSSVQMMIGIIFGRHVRDWGFIPPKTALAASSNVSKSTCRWGP